MTFRMGALILANFAATAVVGIVAMLGMAAYVAHAPSDGVTGTASLIGSAIIFGVLAGLIAIIIAFPAYLVGLIAIGIPTWWLLHRVGWAGAWIFTFVAAAESVIAGASVSLIMAPASLAFTPLLSLPGAIAGWTIWRNGYGTVTPPPAPSS